MRVKWAQSPLLSCSTRRVRWMNLAIQWPTPKTKKFKTMAKTVGMPDCRVLMEIYWQSLPFQFERTKIAMDRTLRLDHFQLVKCQMAIIESITSDQRKEIALLEGLRPDHRPQRIKSKELVGARNSTFSIKIHLTARRNSPHRPTLRINLYLSASIIAQLPRRNSKVISSLTRKFKKHCIRSVQFWIIARHS